MNPLHLDTTVNVAVDNARAFIVAMARGRRAWTRFPQPGANFQSLNKHEVLCSKNIELKR